MSYDYGERLVRLDDLTEEIQPGTGYAFCVTHADRLSPPMGWTLTDHRATTRLFAPLEVA
jgi:hypothetical protein